MRRRQSGFSLIELLVVVAIILIIAAIAIPNLVRSRISANEASAVASLRAINTSCASYSMTYGINFPASLTNLGPVAAGTTATSTSADLVDSVLASGIKAGYSFTYTPGTSNLTYTLTARPTIVGSTGNRFFFTDQTAVITYNVGAAATASSSPISN